MSDRGSASTPEPSPVDARYWLFAGDTYYPRGGWEDYQGTYDSLAEAMAEGRRLRDARKVAWWHVAHPNDGIVADHIYEADYK